MLVKWLEVIEKIVVLVVLQRYDDEEVELDLREVLQKRDGEKIELVDDEVVDYVVILILVRVFDMYDTVEHQLIVLSTLDDEEVLEENDGEELFEYFPGLIRDGVDVELLQNSLERKLVWLEVELDEDV